MAKANNQMSVRGDLLWREVTRSVAPLRGRAAPVSPAPVSAPPVAVEKGRTGEPGRIPGLNHFSGIDRANAERLKRGLHPIEARLDLHGKTQAEAHHLLAAFVHSSSEAGR